MAGRQLHRDHPPVRKAEHIRVAHAELLEQRGGVVRHLLEGEGPIDVGRVAVALLFGRDHVVRARQLWQDCAEGRLHRRATTVEQHERSPAAVLLVIHAQAVHRRVRSAISAGRRTGSERRDRERPQRFHRDSGIHHR